MDEGLESRQDRAPLHMLNAAVLVLNGNYEPLNVTRVRRALLLLLRGKAEMIEDGRGTLQSVSATVAIPSVIRLAAYIRRPSAPRRLTRREVFARDRQTCQYCGRSGRDLTLDHVVPRHRGGRNTWDNVVAACVPCNHRKAGRTPQEAGMRLLHQPGLPSFSAYYPFYRFLAAHQDWQRFVPLARGPTADS